ncbi:MAG: MerR family DNA-binding transcriptional regulator, partial [Promethearchaeota archaeon]
MNASSYLSIGLTAAMLGVSTKTLRRWDKNGKLKPAFRT